MSLSANQTTLMEEDQRREKRRSNSGSQMDMSRPYEGEHSMSMNQAQSSSQPIVSIEQTQKSNRYLSNDLDNSSKQKSRKNTD